MLDEDEKEKIRLALSTARDRWGRRELEAGYAELEASGPTRSKHIHEEALLDFYFITKYSWIPGFYSHVEKEMTKGSYYKRQIQLVAKAALVSIVREGWFEMGDVEGRSTRRQDMKIDDASDENEYTRRQLQSLLKDDLSGIVFETAELSSLGPRDLRKTAYSTVFSQGTIPRTPESLRSIGTQLVEGELLRGSPQLDDLKEISSLLNLVNPAHLRAILDTRGISLRILNQIKCNNPMERDRRDFLKDEFGRLDKPLVVFTHDVHSIVGKKWWRKRKRKTQRELIERSFPFKISNGSLSRVCTLYRNLKLTEEDIAFHLFLASNGVYIGIGQEVHYLISSFTYDLHALPEEFMGILAQNIAKWFESKDDMEEAFEWMDRAVDHLRDANSPYRLMVALKCRGEMRIRNGNVDSGEEDLSSARSIIPSIESDQERFGAYWNLASCFRRLQMFKEEYDTLVSCLDFIDSIENMDLKIIFNDRLIRIRSIM